MTTAHAQPPSVMDRLRWLFQPEYRDLVICRRPARPEEISGRRTLVRAGFTTAVGGAIITLTAFAFGPRFFASDVRAFGLLLGLVMIGLGATAPLDPGSRKTTTGVMVVACAIVAFPVAAGGYFVGSIVAVVGGSLLIAYEPSTDVFQVRVHRAGWVRRQTALMVDVVAAFVVQRVMYSLVPDFFETTVNVIVAWAFSWLLVAVLPAMWMRRTPGRILLALRVVEPRSGERSGFGAALTREVVRGIVAIGSVMVLLRALLGADLRILRFLAVLSGLVLVTLVVERFRLVERLTGTVSSYDAIVTLHQPAISAAVDLTAIEAAAQPKMIDLTAASDVREPTAVPASDRD